MFFSVFQHCLADVYRAAQCRGWLLVLLLLASWLLQGCRSSCLLGFMPVGCHRHCVHVHGAGPRVGWVFMAVGFHGHCIHVHGAVPRVAGFHASGFSQAVRSCYAHSHGAVGGCVVFETPNRALLPLLCCDTRVRGHKVLARL